MRRLSRLEKIALTEIKRRGLHKKPEQVQYRDRRFTHQNDYLNARDTSRYRTALCTRRAGKTRGEVIDFLEIGSGFPDSRMVLGGLTVTTVEEVALDMFKEMDEYYKIGLQFRKGDHKILIPGGSEIQMFGLDASVKQMRKILGRKLRKATVDEAGSITTGLEKTIKQGIKPALADLRPYSWLSLIGTPENIPNTYYEKVTTGKDLEIPWDNHAWTGYDNPFMAKQWAAEVTEMVENNPLVINASWFKTHYLGEWCTDDEMLIIHFDDDVNYIKKFNKTPGVDWHYILGVDIGFNDATAFVILATSTYSEKTFVLESFKQVEMDFTDVANTIKKICTKYPINYKVIDGANKQGVQEIIKRHGVHLENAEKVEKNIHLRLLDDDLKMGKLVVVMRRNEDLVEEWKQLVWKDEMKDTEDPRSQNHLSDACLYAWRKSLHFVGNNVVKKPEYNSHEQQLKWEKEEVEQLMADKDEEDFLY